LYGSTRYSGRFVRQKIRQKIRQMKNFAWLIGIGALIVGIVGFAPIGESPMALEIGSKAPMVDTKMEGINGTSVSLNDLKKENGLLVVFSCNTCPFVVGNGSKEGWEGRYNGIYDFCVSNELGMVLVNSNEAKREGDDSMDKMKSHAKEQGYKMAYVIDQNHELADAVGARTTPHVYLFDKELKLVYRGLIDDNVNSAANVKVNHLENAINNLINGAKPDPAITKSMGCSIKRIN